MREMVVIGNKVTVAELPKLLSIDDAGIALGGVSRSTLETWLCQGRIKRTKIGRRTMIAAHDLQHFIDSCQESA